MLHFRFLLVLALFCTFFACHKTQKVKLKKLDLTAYGIPMTILAPDSVEVKSKDYHIIRDITIRKGDQYYLQIFESTATNDVAEVKLSQLESVRQDKYFKEVIREDDYGFIFRKEIDSTLVDYDFRFVKILNGKEIIFQTGMIGTFSLDDVTLMYEGVSRN